jgi:23S rRNA (adenine2503-C2)-methyltransferase
MPAALIGLELSEIQQLMGNDEPRFRARQLYQALYRNRVGTLEEITTLPLALRRRLEAEWDLGLPEEEKQYSSADGARRYLWRLGDGRTVEAVLMPEEGRDTVCISTQVGCPVDCKFCLTALMGLERNLTAGEIVSQVLVVAAAHGLDPETGRLNVVMMGQGEPLLNLPNVLKASRLLTDRGGFGLSPRRITLSTSGIIPKLVELGQADIRPKLSISLNASSEEQRRELMPITRKYHLKELLDVCRVYPLRPWEKLTFEYVLLRNVNDSDEDARRVVKLLANLRCKVNLIALNPGQGIPFETPAAERVLAFQRILRRAFPCFVRKPRGRDIYAACGQLKRVTVEESLVRPNERGEKPFQTSLRGLPAMEAGFRRPIAGRK